MIYIKLVFTNPFTESAGTSKINYFDGASSRVAQQNVFRLEIAVYYVDFGRRQKQQGGAQLVKKKTFFMLNNKFFNALKFYSIINKHHVCK